MNVGLTFATLYIRVDLFSELQKDVKSLYGQLFVLLNCNGLSWINPEAPLSKNLNKITTFILSVQRLFSTLLDICNQSSVWLVWKIY